MNLEITHPNKEMSVVDFSSLLCEVSRDADGCSLVMAEFEVPEKDLDGTCIGDLVRVRIKESLIPMRMRVDKMECSLQVDVQVCVTTLHCIGYDNDAQDGFHALRQWSEDWAAKG